MAFNPKASKAAAKPSPAAAKAKPAAKPPARRKSKYAGAGEGEDREPLPFPGAYRFRVLTSEEKESEKPGGGVYVKATLEIVAQDDRAAEHHEIGDVVAFIQKTDGKSASFGPQAVNRFLRPALGFEAAEDLAALGEDEAADMIDASLGLATATQDTNPVIGRLVDAVVEFGKPVLDKDKNPTGDHYREYKWSVVPEEDQE